MKKVLLLNIFCDDMRRRELCLFANITSSLHALSRSENALYDNGVYNNKEFETIVVPRINSNLSTSMPEITQESPKKGKKTKRSSTSSLEEKQIIAELTRRLAEQSEKDMQMIKHPTPENAFLVVGLTRPSTPTKNTLNTKESYNYSETINSKEERRLWPTATKVSIQSVSWKKNSKQWRSTGDIYTKNDIHPFAKASKNITLLKTALPTTKMASNTKYDGQEPDNFNQSIISDEDQDLDFERDANERCALLEDQNILRRSSTLDKKKSALRKILYKFKDFLPRASVKLAFKALAAVP